MNPKSVTKCVSGLELDLIRPKGWPICISVKQKGAQGHCYQYHDNRHMAPFQLSFRAKSIELNLIISSRGVKGKGGLQNKLPQLVHVIKS